MGFRTIVIQKRCKLSLELNSLVIRSDSELRVHLGEISTLIIENTGVAITTALLVEMSKRNINVLMCDEKRNPTFSIMPIYGAHNSSGRISEQINWDQQSKDELWRLIVSEKIHQQALVLLRKGLVDAYNMLKNYISEVSPNDSTNREGHAAKVYFNALFGNDFSRREANDINAALNYGYSIILSMINREIWAYGCLTQLGIWHQNEYNHYNLSCDLMEPFRPIVDQKILLMDDLTIFKKVFADLANINVTYDAKNMRLDRAINLYVKNVLRCLAERTPEKVLFVTDYEL
ncbi:MAG: type II CRISPR-associated endonuclease Cas1 [Bacteroidales bacterium]|nr:type II CRISPR-associated endonuclease Cas1 [Bacteroidales bacterium]